MTTLRRQSATLLLTALVLAASSLASGQDPNRGLRVRLLLYSGRPDPTYALESQDGLSYVRTYMARAKKIRFKGGTVLAGTLGYQGILVENVGGVAGIPGSFALYNGRLETTAGKQRRFYADRGRALETFLVEQAIEKGALDQETAKRLEFKPVGRDRPQPR